MYRLAAFGGQVKDSYGLTNNQNDVTHYTACAGAIVSFLLCMFVYGSAIWVRSYKQCRHTLDRVSFRLLMWAMSSEFWYSIFYVAIYISPHAYRPGGPLGPRMCSYTVFFLVGTMGAVNYLTTCIAINLMLTICFGINPLRLRLERWYIGVSFFLAYLIPIPSAALKHFGYDPQIQACWIKTPDVTTRFIWSIMAIYLWQILATLISLVCVVATLVVLFRQARATKKAMFGGSQLNRMVITGDDGAGEKTFPGLAAPLGTVSVGGAKKENSQVGESTASSPMTLVERQDGPASDTRSMGATPFHPMGRYQQWRKEAKAATAARREARNSNTMNSLSDRFFGIALRVSSYPLVLIIINTILTVGDLVLAARGGVTSRADYALYCLFTFFYGSRGLFFAALVIFVDPSLMRGIKAAWAERKAARDPTFLDSQQGITTTTPILAYIEATPVDTPDPEQSSKQDPAKALRHSPSNGSGKSFDLAAALSYLPSPTIADTELKIRFPASTSGPSSHHFSPGHTSRPPSPRSHFSQFPSRAGSTVSADFASLARIPTRPGDLHEGRRWSRHFPGVEEDALPPSLTDEVDISRQKGKRPPIARSATSRSSIFGVGRKHSASTSVAGSGSRRSSHAVGWREMLGELMARDEEHDTGGELSEEERRKAEEEREKRFDQIEGHL